MSQADDEIRRCLDQDCSFLLDAGAGAGKTHSLVEALKHLVRTRAEALVRNGQQIACITFTNAAKDEIIGRTGNTPVARVSTIHDFLWDAIKWHQKPLKAAVVKFNDSLSADSGRRKEPADLVQALGGIAVTYSDAGSNFLEGRLFHDDVLGVARVLFACSRLLSRLIAAKFPVIFVDEYQDTSAAVVEILFDGILAANPGTSVIGLFGDKMQNIYHTGENKGIGEVPPRYLERLKVIPKGENHRCSEAVIGVLNHLRTDIVQFAVAQNVKGIALYINATSQTGGDLVAAARQAALQRPDWNPCVQSERELYLTHRLIAGKGGYRDLLEVFGKRSGFHRDRLLNGEDPRVAFFIDRAEPLAAAWTDGKAGQALSLLHRGGFRISSNAGKKAVREALEALIALRAGGTVRQVLSHIRDQNLLPVPDEFRQRLVVGAASPMNPMLDADAQEREERERAFYEGIFDLAYTEVSAFVSFFNEHTPFATKHGVKGLEFDNVFVVLDDSGAHWSLYSFDKFLNGTDASGNEGRYRRTRNLFYVCCSRAKQGLAVVDLAARSAAKDEVVRAMFGAHNCVYL